jgi:hypothetical protein
MRSMLLVSARVTEFHATEAHSDVTKVQYSIKKLSRGGKGKVTVRIKPSNLTD